MTLDELVVKLVLDATGFSKGQADATEALAKTKTSAVASSKAIEASALSASQGVEKLGRQFLGLFALLTGAAGVKAFLSDLTTTDAALGRTAKNLDMSGRALSAWQGAAEVAGGSAQGITGSMASLSNAMQTAALTGNNSLAPVFRALGINLATTGGKARDMTSIMFDLNRAAQGMDPARFATMMRMVGADDGTIALLEKSTTEFGKLYAEQQKYAANSEDIEAAQSRQTGWRQLSLTVVSLGRSIATALTPVMVQAMQAAQNWADAYGPWLRGEIVAKVGEFVTWLQKLDWGSIGKQATDFARNVRDIAVALAEGVKGVDGNSPIFKAFEAFGALLIGSRVLGAINLVTGAMGAFGRLPIPPALAALLFNPAVLGTAAVGAVLASGDPDKSVLAGGHPDVQPQDNDTGLPGVDNRPSDTSDAQAKAGGVWDWIKNNALPDFGKAKEQLQAFGKATGFGDKLHDDPKVKDAITDTAKATSGLLDIAKRQSEGMPGSLGGDTAGGGGVMDRVRRTLSFAATASGGQAGRGGGPSSLKSAGQKANAAIIADELRKAGVPDEGIAASLGSMQTESTFNPRAHNDVSGGHTGLIQWDKTRWSKVRTWIEKQGGDPWDARWQARAYIAEGRAKPGDALYDGARTAQGFKNVENSKGDLPRAVHGLYDIERFGPGEEGGRAAHAMKWMGHLPEAPDASPSAMAPAPAGTSAKAIGDAEVMAARQRIINGSRNPADRAIVDRYKEQQNTPHPVTYDHAIRHVLKVMAHARHLTDHTDKPVRVLPVGLDGSPHHTAAMANMVHMAAASGYSSVRHNIDNSMDTQIHGGVHVHTAATDARGIAGDLDKYLFAGADARQANRGLA